MQPLTLAIFVVAALPVPLFTQHEGHEPLSAGLEEGLGQAHMQTSCASTVSVNFDRGLALLHNFWYSHALERFNQVAKNDPECAMAYWGAAMTYNHPFWDPPSQTDEAAAWSLVQSGLKVRKASAREKLYLAAVAALYKDAGTGSKSSRDQHYRGWHGGLGPCAASPGRERHRQHAGSLGPARQRG